jgi:hypothetical protein
MKLKPSLANKITTRPIWLPAIDRLTPIIRPIRPMIKIAIRVGHNGRFPIDGVRISFMFIVLL